MHRVYVHYKLWEDYPAGQYNVTYSDCEVESAENLLKDPALFLTACNETIAAWPNASLHNLSNEAQNRRSWLGQATCCYKFGAPAAATKKAWRTLERREQENANLAADEAIIIWMGGVSKSESLI